MRRRDAVEFAEEDPPARVHCCSMLLPLVRTKKHVDRSSSSARRWRGGLPSVRRRTGATRRLPGPLYIKVCASRYCYGARTSGMRLDETLRLRLVTSQGSPYPSRSPRRLVSYTPLAPLATGTAFIYLDVFDRAVDICRQRSCANCCSIPALAELDTALLRCSLSSTLLASAAQSAAHTWQCARAAVAAAVPPL